MSETKACAQCGHENPLSVGCGEVAYLNIPDIRLQVATAAMQAILTRSYASAKPVAVSAVKYADALLYELNIERK